MRLFPYILSRVGGLPFDQIDKLSWSDKKVLEEYFKKMEEIESHQSKILDELLAIIKVIEDYPAKFYLKILRRDIFNQRSIKLRDFEYRGTFEQAFSKVVEGVKTFKESRKAWKTQQADFHNFYNKEINRSRDLLQQEALPEALSKGLQLASHSLLQRLQNYQKKGVALNKKLFQTERTLLQYLSRVTTKTSPFSSFTKLGLIDFDKKINSTDQRKVRINNSLFSLLRDALIHYPPFFENLEIRLNQSIQSLDDEWVFLLNTRNVESVQRMDKSDLIDFIIESLKEGDFSFVDFVGFLGSHIDAETNQLMGYLLQLLDYGLIEWVWPFSGLDPDWLIKLKHELENNDNPLMIELQEVLTLVENQIVIFENGNLKERKEAQLKAFDHLKAISEKLLEVTELKDLEQVASREHLKNIFTTEFKLSKEQVFYEDVSQVYQSDFSKKEIELFTDELEQLSQVLSSFVYNKKRKTFHSFFKNQYQEKAIPLLNFYSDFHLDQNKVALPTEEVEILKRTSFLDHLLKKGQWIQLDHFHLDFADFPEIDNKNLNQHISKGTLVHFFKNEEQNIKGFVDTVFMGYGKMFGRFLHLFPETLKDAIQANNKRLQKEALWVENVDASIYNPNIHPPLLSAEILMPGSQNNLPSAQQISIRNIEVRLDQQMDEIYLFDSTSQKRIDIFDFGFEALENRSQLYQMLSVFRKELVGPHVLIDLLDNKIVSESENGIVHFPRITIGKHLILRRRAWKIPRVELPLKGKSESDSAYFLRLNQWRQSWSLPEKVFIKVEGDSQRKSDNYKPQYIDFCSPLMVLLFAKLLNRVDGVLRVEEMLPELENGGFVKEYLVEWESE